jgi:UDP-2,3-diacylglucosamine hydrolase
MTCPADPAWARDASALGPVGIIAGSGALPLRVAEAAQTARRPVFIAGLEGWADPAIAAFPHDWVGLGSIGRLIRLLRERGCSEIVFVGSLVRPDLRRPDLRALKVDFGAVRLIPSILKHGAGGDNRLLGRIVRLFEREGFRVLGAHELARDLVAPSGLIAGSAPGAKVRGEIRTGLETARRLGELDIGQAVVVAAGRVVAVEAAEGTDLMLERIASLRASGRLRMGGRSGVLVKVPKPGQDLRIDMPAIGERTIQGAEIAGLAGIAIEAGGVLIADRPGLVAAAERAGLFVLGLPKHPMP